VVRILDTLLSRLAARGLPVCIALPQVSPATCLPGPGPSASILGLLISLLGSPPPGAGGPLLGFPCRAGVPLGGRPLQRAAL